MHCRFLDEMGILGRLFYARNVLHARSTDAVAMYVSDARMVSQPKFCTGSDARRATG